MLFLVTVLHWKAILGRRQPMIMRWFFLLIMPLCRISYSTKRAITVLRVLTNRFCIWVLCWLFPDDSLFQETQLLSNNTMWEEFDRVHYGRHKMRTLWTAASMFRLWALLCADDIDFQFPSIQHHMCDASPQTEFSDQRFRPLHHWTAYITGTDHTRKQKPWVSTPLSSCFCF